jgi:sec-independent protein translocase protein TatA
MPGPVEWVLIAVVVLVLFGAKKVPEMARALGRSSSEFKKGMREGAVAPDDPATNQSRPAE